ncbi:MAG: endo alpha-1,4 polygalactosaminidase [Methylobacterium frigidaeris]
MMGCVGAGSVARARPGRAPSKLARPDASWVVFYGEDIALDRLAAFDVAVLDADFRGDVGQLGRQGCEVLAYLSLGEIKKSSRLYRHLDDPGVLLAENPNWPDTFVCDVRRPSWQSLILDRALPTLVARGFTGVFFDTLDTPPHLEQTDPDRYAGMRLAAIDLVRAIRRSFPDLVLLMNRGYALLPDLKPELDGVVAESLLTTYDFAARTYKWVDQEQLTYHMQALQVLTFDPHILPILSLDYWECADTATVREIYAQERGFGHNPYVAEVLLDRIFPEPPS